MYGVAKKEFLEAREKVIDLSRQLSPLSAAKAPAAALAQTYETSATELGVYSPESRIMRTLFRGYPKYFKNSLSLATDSVDHR